MASVTLIHSERMFTVPTLQMMTKCSLFQKNPTLLVSPYRVHSPVSLSMFREFLTAVKGNAIKITERNFRELQRLSEEFGFSELTAKLSEFRPSMDLKQAKDAEESDSRGRLAVLEERSNQHDCALAALQAEVRRIAAHFARLPDDASTPTRNQRSLPPNRSVLKPLPPLPPPGGQSPANQAVPSFSSRIVSGFPEIFAEFRKRQFKLLWRGSSDGFGAKEFHRRCDGHANTLTVISDTKGNVFGGFTPLRWDSANKCKEDESMRSFVFTLRNPHSFGQRRFELTEEDKWRAIFCYAEKGPSFHDIGVYDNCNANSENYASLGNSYLNDTGIEGWTVFTGAHNFQVEEIEVWEITG